MNFPKHSHERFFIGLDLGTGGVRAMAVSGEGEVAASASVPLAAEILAPQPGRHEQPPQAWWEAACRALTMLTAKLAEAGVSPRQLAAMAVDGTSGTLVVLDRQGEPLRPAMMYNDPRGEEQASGINRIAAEFCQKLGYQFKSSFALAKIAWLRDNEPQVFEGACCFVHQADYIVGRLSGCCNVSDYSNALKTGYDLVDERWPDWIGQITGGVERLPRVVSPGTPLGAVSRQAAARTGLPEGLCVAAGASDGTAACLASGVSRPGDYNTTLGTTLVFKGISRQICRHPEGLVYCHKLPGGLWLPGAAGNTGCEWIGTMFAGENPQALDAAAAEFLPNECLAYPLARTGERFPFLAPRAEGFFAPSWENASKAERFAACLQGTALLERLSYEVLDRIAGVGGGEIFSAGGGSKSDVWMQCRADVTGRVIHRGACGESAFGAAILAAAAGGYDSLAEAVRAMVRLERSFAPNAGRAGEYDRLFELFCDELRNREYL